MYRMLKCKHHRPWNLNCIPHNKSIHLTHGFFANWFTQNLTKKIGWNECMTFKLSHFRVFTTILNLKHKVINTYSLWWMKRLTPSPRCSQSWGRFKGQNTAVNSLTLVRNEWILLLYRLIFKLLAQMEKLKFWKNIKILHAKTSWFSSGQVKFGVTCPDG